MDPWVKRSKAKPPEKMVGRVPRLKEISGGSSGAKWGCGEERGQAGRERWHLGDSLNALLRSFSQTDFGAWSVWG